MKIFFKTLLKHPVSVICYGLYSWLCYNIYVGKLKYHHWIKVNQHNPHTLSYAEGVTYSLLFLLLMGAIFALVLLVNALVRKEVAFYVWLIAIIFIQALLVLSL